MWCTMNMNMITKFSYRLSSEVGARKNIYIVKVERLIFRLKSLKKEMEVGAGAQGLRLDRPGSWGQLIHGVPQGTEGGGSRTMEAGLGKVCRLMVRILEDSLGLKISTLSTPALTSFFRKTCIIDKIFSKLYFSLCWDTKLKRRILPAYN